MQAARDFVQLGKFPHWLAVIITLTCFFGVLFWLAQRTVDEAHALLSDVNFERQLTQKIAEVHLQLCALGYNIAELAELADMKNETAAEADDEPALVEFEDLLVKVSPITTLAMDCSFAVIMLVCMMFARVHDATQALKKPHMMSVAELVESQLRTYLLHSTRCVSN